MVLTAPANEIETKLALEFALGQDKPVVIRYPKDFVPQQEFIRTACSKPFRLGKSVLVKRSKKSAVAIVSYGSVLTEALRAAELLAEDGIAVDVINGRFAAPVDEKIVSLLEQGKGIITVEDHASACGFGSAVLELAAASSHSPKAIRLLGAPRRFIGHNSRDGKRNAYCAKSGDRNPKYKASTSDQSPKVKTQDFEYLNFEFRYAC
jgi:deoxyxylulose-5-phosphate synthase